MLRNSRLAFDWLSVSFFDYWAIRMSGVLPFFHWIDPLLHWITWKLHLFLNQSEVSNFPCILLVKKKGTRKTIHLIYRYFLNRKWRRLANVCSTVVESFTTFYYTHFEITDGPCNLIGSNWCDLFTNRTTFCFKSYLVPSQWGGYIKNKTRNQISRLV